MVWSADDPQAVCQDPIVKLDLRHSNLREGSSRKRSDNYQYGKKLN